MSCTFWLRRKRLAAQKRNAEALAKAEQAASATKAAEQKAAEKPVKKAVQKNNDETAN